MVTIHHPLCLGMIITTTYSGRINMICNYLKKEKRINITTQSCGSYGYIFVILYVKTKHGT